MAEYIEREAAYEDFEKCNSENQKWTPSRVKTLIARQKAADVAQVRYGCCKKSDGKDEWYTYYYTCVECGANMMVADADYHDVSPNYCPACGARMDLEEV